MNTATIELLCGMIEDPECPDEQERWSDTVTMWSDARELADELGIDTHFSRHVERGTHYGDAYLYPPLARLRRRYPARAGVAVNLKGRE